MHVFINDVQSFAIRLCFIPIIILAQMACVHGNESNHYGQKIDKVYGRPNIDQHYPHSIDNGMRRRSGEMSGAHHYNNNNRVAFKNKILQYANRRGEFHYNDKKGCKANIYFVHWPIIGENQYESDNENKEQHADTKNHYEARPADEYGFKKLVVELHDVYDEKAHQPPKLDLSDLIYPANDYVQESIQGYQYNGYEAPIEPPYNTQHDDYQHTADEIDKFGVLPYQEVQPYSATNTAAIEPLPPSPPEIYPDGHDKFSYLPYKESDGQQNKYNEYNTVPPAPGAAKRYRPERRSEKKIIEEKTFNPNDFRSELDSVAEIDAKESKPGTEVLSEAFMQRISESPSKQQIEEKFMKNETKDIKKLELHESTKMFVTTISNHFSTGDVISTTMLSKQSTENDVKVNSTVGTTGKEETSTQITITTILNHFSADDIESTKQTIANDFKENSTIVGDIVEKENLTKNRRQDEHIKPTIMEKQDVSFITTTNIESVSDDNNVELSRRINNDADKEEMSELAATTNLGIEEESNRLKNTIFLTTTKYFSLENDSILANNYIQNPINNSYNSGINSNTNGKRGEEINIWVKTKPKNMITNNDYKITIPDVTVTAIPELAAISTLQTIITAAQTLPISLASTPEFTTQTSGTLTPSIKDSLTLISSTTNILTALANAQAEAEKLPEPGPPVACSGEKISVGECSALFTCKATGQLFTCWDEQVPENFNLVYDSVSQSCRNFNALRECSRDAFCANEATTRDSTGRPFFPLGGNCTRIAHDCFGMMETITCEIDGQVIDPTASGDCVLAREVPGCEPLITRQ